METQAEASVLKNKLFSSGLDTLEVIDSLHVFFDVQKNVLAVESDSQGVAVDYENGVSGAIFFGVFNYETKDGDGKYEYKSAKSNQSDLKNSEVNDVIYPTFKNPRTIYFDGAYSQKDFKENNDKVLSVAEESFSKVGLNAFESFFDDDATVDVLKTLQDYGLVHITGHGYYRSKNIGVNKAKLTYLLTGELATVEKTFNKHFDDILEKNIIIVTYHGENRYAVSPEFISKYNQFPDEGVFVYLGICNGRRGNWDRELVNNNGVETSVGYIRPVVQSKESYWVSEMYRKMCNTSLDEPLTIYECGYELFKERKYYIDLDHNHNTVFVGIKPYGNPDFVFWEPAAKISKVWMGIQNMEIKYEAECIERPLPDNQQLSHTIDQFIESANLVKTDNGYVLTWQDVPYWNVDETHTVMSGLLEFRLRNEEMTQVVGKNYAENIAEDVHLEMHWRSIGPSDLGWDYMYLGQTSEAVYREYEFANEIRLFVDGEETCNNSFYYHNQECRDSEPNSNFIFSTTGAGCDANSGFYITLRKIE
ncbi:MAG TPA: hypothetical protein VJ951_16435 [Bacteroidales bacterium]|nr:hypothetical protein [Bacteroidales bacterium]